jgi:8-oxo-dGTP diphosphatase
MTKERFKLVSATHLLLVKERKILLSRRYNTGYEDGNYSVIAGHLDGGEPATLAMVREALEKGGIIIQPSKLKAVHIMHRSADSGASNERIDFFFIADAWEGEPTIMEPDKCDDLSWFPLNELPSNMVPYVKFGIENYLAKVYFSEFGWE